MEEAIKMLVEYVLEENASMKTQIRGLEKKNLSLEEQNDNLYQRSWKRDEERCKLKDILKKRIEWRDGKPTNAFLWGEDLEVICEVLGIDEHDKAVL